MQSTYLALPVLDVLDRGVNEIRAKGQRDDLEALGARRQSPSRPGVGFQPEAYDPKLDVDFTPLRERGLIAAGLGQAA
ncbi:hypothetical protein [Streptomyces sp. NPDC004267]|uniref:hypothetical protein n=1 Tax=Streptomyces sp. NPDC004267 TaxID=3364694 RepID=UPI00369C7585